MECIAKNPTLYLDVSHNDEGIQRSVEYAKDQSEGRLFIIFGGAKDKKYNARTFKVLNQAQTSFCLFSNPRSKSKEDWKQATRFFEKEPPIFSNLNEAIERIKPLMAQEDTLLITGSFFLISDYKPSYWQINRL